LLDFASFLGTILLWTFWRFSSKGGECETKASLWLMPTSGFKDAYKWFQGYETKGGECEHEDQKGGSLI
jgi:hypothetical protein